MFRPPFKFFDMEKINIADPAQEPLQAFLTASLQLGTVLDALLQFTGPARLVISTYSTGEEFLNKLFSLKKKGIVLNAICYTDLKAAEKTAKNNTMMKLVYDKVYLCKNHSKVALIFGENMNVVVLSSQNTTRGNRLESYTIIKDDTLVSKLLHSLENYYSAELW